MTENVNTNPEAGTTPAPAADPTVARLIRLGMDPARAAAAVEQHGEYKAPEPGQYDENLIDPGTGEQRQQEEEEEGDGHDERTIQTDVNLAVPEFLDPERARPVEAYVGDGLADVVKSSGMSSDVANTLVQLAVDDAMGTAQVPLDDRNANEVVLRNDWGTKFDERVKVVRDFVHRTPGLADYLERTGLGNSPSVVRAIYLHASGVTTLSKAEAQRRIDEAMKPGSAYMKGDKEAVREVRALTNIVHAGGSKAPERPVAPKPSQASGLQDERTRLMKSPAFLDSKHKDHKATLEWYKEVTEELYGGGAA